MGQLTRRDFIKRSFAAGMAGGLLSGSRILGANDDVRVAVVGFRGQGRSHIKWLKGLPGVRIVGLCDPDRHVLDRGVQEFEKANEKVEGYTDVRKLLESKDIDAIVTATPDHWHCLVTVWACQAGKDVYVEKPLSYCLWEGRKAVEAARKYNRIVQWGNQDHNHVIKDLHLEKEGSGKILVAYADKNRMRKPIGKVSGPQTVPDHIDYDLWCGPAPHEPLMRKNLHYDWHWVWPTGTGELGNNGIYPLNALRLALGQTALPKRAMSLGGRFLFNDDAETPNTQIAFLEYDPGPLVICEVRNMPSEKGPKTKGGKIKWEGGESAWPSQPSNPGDTGGYKRHQGHLYNFIQAVRSRKVEDLRADVVEGHLSTAMVHMPNISHRLGDELTVEEARERVQDRGSEAVERFEGMKAHLEANGVDFSQAKITVGPWLELDPDTERFVGHGDVVQRANQLVKPVFREPFVIPETV